MKMFESNIDCIWRRKQQQKQINKGKKISYFAFSGANHYLVMNSKIFGWQENIFHNDYLDDDIFTRFTKSSYYWMWYMITFCCWYKYYLWVDNCRNDWWFVGHAALQKWSKVENRNNDPSSGLVAFNELLVVFVLKS